MRTTDTKSRPQRVNSYKLNLFTDTYYGHCGDQVNPVSRSGESRLADDVTTFYLQHCAVACFGLKQ